MTLAVDLGRKVTKQTNKTKPRDAKSICKSVDDIVLNARTVPGGSLTAQPSPAPKFKNSPATDVHNA